MAYGLVAACVVIIGVFLIYYGTYGITLLLTTKSDSTCPQLEPVKKWFWCVSAVVLGGFMLWEWRSFAGALSFDESEASGEGQSDEGSESMASHTFKYVALVAILFVIVGCMKLYVIAPMEGCEKNEDGVLPQVRNVLADLGILVYVILLVLAYGLSRVLMNFFDHKRAEWRDGSSSGRRAGSAIKGAFRTIVPPRRVVAPPGTPSSGETRSSPWWSPRQSSASHPPAVQAQSRVVEKNGMDGFEDTTRSRFDSLPDDSHHSSGASSFSGD